MPIYEYLCSACDEKFEELRKMSDESAVHCTHCKSSSVKKVVSASAFQLKGGGWYKDGYASSSKKTAEKSNSVSKTETPKASPAATKSNKD